MKHESKERLDINFAEKYVNKKKRRSSDTAFCLLCKKAVKLINYWHAAEYLKIEVEEISRLAQIRQLHRIHNKCGTTMICSASLFSFFQNRQTQPLNPAMISGKAADFRIENDR
jgi:hypothetical protein